MRASIVLSGTPRSASPRSERVPQIVQPATYARFLAKFGPGPLDVSDMAVWVRRNGVTEREDTVFRLRFAEVLYEPCAVYSKNVPELVVERNDAAGPIGGFGAADGDGLHHQVHLGPAKACRFPGSHAGEQQQLTLPR